MCFLRYCIMSQKNTTKKLLKALLLAVLVCLLVAGGGLLYYISVFSSPNIYTPEGKTISFYVKEGTPVEEVIDSLNRQTDIRKLNTLMHVIDHYDFRTSRSGHYVIRNGMSNRELVQRLQRGLQTPVRVTLNNIRTKEQLAQSLSRQLMPDSLDFVLLFNDNEFLDTYGLDTDNAMVAFIPDTYELYWNMEAQKVFEKFYKEYEKFWTTERKEKAAAIPLTPVEVSILASIVEEETNKSFEYPVVAGLYINRLKKGMLLQADPTVKFAVGDFALRRVLNVHLQTDSPYNTYKYKGLPPGPIRLPSAKVVDAVLNYEQHNYIYMAAKETLNGEHNFATNLKDHNRNAEKYRRALNKLGIYR